LVLGLLDCRVGRGHPPGTNFDEDEVDVVRSSGRAAVRLHLLHRAAEGEASGLSVSEELGRHGYRISPGTLYPLLHGLEAEGLLASAERTENSGILLYYAAATEAGRATLATPAGRWPNSPPICCPHRSRPPPPHRERGEPDDQATGTGTAASSNPCTERPRLPEQGTGQHPTSQREIESSGPREVAFLAGRVRRAVRPQRLRATRRARCPQARMVDVVRTRSPPD